MPLAVVLDRDDARDLLRAAPDCRAVLALTPAARAVLQEAPVPVLSTLALYTSIGHRRTVLHQRRAIAQLEAAFESEPALGPAAREALIIVVSYLTAAAARLRTTLARSGSGPWLVSHAGAWQCCADRSQAFDLLFGRIARTRFDATLRRKFATPPLPWLARPLAELSARAWRGKGAIVLGYGRRQLDLLGREATAANPKRPVLEVRCTSGSWRDLARIARSLGLALSGAPRGALYALPLSAPATREAARRTLAALEDPAARGAAATAAAVALDAAELTAGLARHLTSLFAAARPNVLVTDSLGWGPGGAAGEAARSQGIAVLFLSHSSHAAQSSPTARAAVNQWIRHGRVLSRFATTLLPKTPHAARAAEAARREAGTGACTAPLAPYVWLARKSALAAAPGGKFRILHACNFSPWSEHVPWAMQTSDEFVHGIEILGEVVEKIDDVSLIVRPKDKEECNAEILQQLLPPRRNTVFRRTGSFAQDLADSDLVVSFSSSTIEEALHLRTPVLLWGGGADYRHLPAREAPPEGDSRAAVYAAESREDLERMLPAIIAAHRDRPLRDEELADHLWPSGTPDWKALARSLAEQDNDKTGSGITGI